MVRALAWTFAGTALASSDCSATDSCSADEAILLQGTGVVKRHSASANRDVTRMSSGDDLWPQFDVYKSKCNLNIGVEYVGSQQECQDLAVANGDEFYSYRHNANGEGNKCFSSAHCDDGLIGDRTNDWAIYRANPGALWGQVEVDNSKCNNNVDVQYVDSQADCQAAAEANGHDFYSYRHNKASNDRYKCISSAGCYDGNQLIGDRTNDWRIYRRNTGYTADGCFRSAGGGEDAGTDQHPLQARDATETAHVRCCGDDGTCVSQFPGRTVGGAVYAEQGVDYWRPHSVGETAPHSQNCLFDLTFREAEEACALDGKRLCAPHEIERCCGTGCWHNFADVWVAPALVGTTVDGCPTDNSNPDEERGDQTGELIPTTEQGLTDTAAVRCCSLDGNSCFSTVNGECNDAKTFLEAQFTCSEAGLRLCTTAEIGDNCCGTGCWYNHFAVWTSD